MIITCVHVYVKPQFIDGFIAATMLNHEGTIQEPGNVRFDFLQDANEPSKFLLYEVFKTEADVKAHKETSHYLRWRDAVSDWMDKNREGIRYNLIAPQNSALW